MTFHPENWPSRRLLLVSLLLAVCSSFQNGCISSVLNIPQFTIEVFVNQSHYKESGHYLTVKQETWLWSAIVTQRQVGQFVGTVLCPLITHVLGRKATILVNTIPLVAGNMLQLMSKYFQSWEMLMIGRCIWGVGCGIVAVTIPMFISEIASNRHRGAMASLHGMMIGLGSFTADLLSLPQVLGNENSWSMVYLVILMFQVVQLGILPMCPESPKELYIKRDDVDGAVKSVAFYQEHNPDIQETLQEYEAEKQASHGSSKWAAWSLLCNRELRMSVLVGLGATCAYAFGGMQIVTNYTTEIFVNMKVPKSRAVKASLAVGAIRFFAVFPSMYLVERFGRRVLLLSSIWGCAVCFTLMLILQELNDHGTMGLGNWAIAVILVYGLLFSIGCQTIATFLPSEVTNTQDRAANQSLSVMTRFVVAFITTLAFLPLQRQVGGLCWLILIVPLVFTAMFMQRYMPETKNRPVADILYELNSQRGPFPGRSKMRILVNELAESELDSVTPIPAKQYGGHGILTAEEKLN